MSKVEWRTGGKSESAYNVDPDEEGGPQMRMNFARRWHTNHESGAYSRLILLGKSTHTGLCLVAREALSTGISCPPAYHGGSSVASRVGASRIGGTPMGFPGA